MSDEIARGVINIEARDEGALASLRRVETQFDKTMHEIDRQEAEVRIKADIREFDRELEKAKRELRVLRGEKASAKLDADKKELTKKIKEAEAQVKFLDGMKATVEIDVQGEKDVINAQRAIAKAEEDRSKAEQKYHDDRMKALTQESRRRAALSDQRIREFRQDEAAAFRFNEQMDRNATSQQKEAVHVAQLQREYARLATRIDALKKRNAFTEKARMKLDLDTGEAFAKFELVKAELSRRGKHPPVELGLKVDRSNLNIAQRAGGAVGDFGRKIAQAASGLSTMTIRFGPFTASVKQAFVALSLLAPIITDLIGGATALVGVLGTGLAGAMSIGGGLMTGFAMNALGMVAAIKPIATEIKTAKQATDAYNKAVLQHGKNSKQAKTAQEAMNNTLKNVSPAARSVAKGLSDLSTNWTKAVGATAQHDIAKTMGSGIKTVNKLMPTLAHNTKDTMNIVSNAMDNAFKGMRSGEGQRIIGSLGRSANNFLGPALSAATHLGAAFARVGESAARIFGGRAGNALNDWAKRIDSSTKDSGKLDATITRLGNHAKDLGRLFMDVGRLLKTVFNGGADAGDNLVNQLDHAVKSWNEFLSSTQGKESMGQFFRRSADSVSSLAGALAPLIAAVGDWSNMLSPFTRGILDAISVITRFVGFLTHLLGMAGGLKASFTALGATFATLWAIGKAAAFVSMLSRIVTLTKEAVAVARGGSILGGLGKFAGGIGGALKGGGAAGAGGAAAAAELRAGGAAAAAEMEAGAAAAAAELEAGGAAAAAEAGGAAAAAAGGGAAAAGETAAVGGLGAAFATAAGGVLLLEGGIYALGRALGKGKVTADTFVQSLDFNVKTSAQAAHNYNVLRGTLTDVGSSYARTRLGIEQARKSLDATKKGTIEHKMALLDYRDAVRNNIETRNKWIDQSRKMQDSARTEATTAQKSISQNDKAIAALKQRIQASGRNTNPADLNKLRQLEAEHNKLAATASAAWNRMAAAPLNAQRAYRGMMELTGKAEQAMGKLARAQGGKSIAQKISLKYDDPNKAGQVATKAKNALQQGVGKGTVMRIIADSSSADEAIRRLRSARITPKKLQILESGGRAAIHTLEQIIGRKLTKKEQRIASAGGPAVIAMLERILGKNLPRKTQILVQQGGGAVLNAMSNINAYVLHNKSFSIHIANDVIGGLHSIQSAIDSIHGKSVGVSVHRGKAMGGVIEPRAAGASLIQRAAVQARHQKPIQETRGGKYSQPTLLVGEEKRREYVIATNPAYRENNKRYLKEAAQDFGMVVVEPAAGGKRRAKGFDTRRHSIGQRAHGIPPKLRDYVGPVDTSDLDDLVTRAEGRYNDYKSKRDSVIQDNKSRKRGHKHRVPDAGRQRKLLTDWRQLATYARKAKNEKRKFEDLETEIDTLRTAMQIADKSPSGTAEFENKTYNFAGLRNKRRDKINARTRELSAALKDLPPGGRGSYWVRKLQQALTNSRADFQENDTTLSTPEQTAADAIKSAADDKASRERDSMATYGSAGGADEFDRLQAALARAQADDVPDDPATIYKNEAADSAANNVDPTSAIATFWEGVTKRLDVPGADQGKVASAYQSLKGARDDLRSIQDATNPNGGGAAGTTVGAQMMALSSARGDLYSQYGSNLSPVWSQPGNFPTAASPLPAPGAYGVNPNTTSSTRPTVVNQTINMSEPPPDPHSWSQGVAWELQSAV